MSAHESQPDSGELRGILPEPSQKDMRGGTWSHKPGCKCKPCSPRTRQQEALTLPNGDGGTDVAPVEALEESNAVLEADEIIIAPVGKRTRRTKRAIIGEWLRLRTINPDITGVDAAQEIGIARQYLYRVISQATREGWLKFDDPMSRVEHELIPKTLDNLNSFLDARDQKVTIEMAKGTIFKAYQEAKGLNPVAQTVLALKNELPASAEAPRAEIIEGQIVGQPKVLIGIKDETQS